MRLHLQDATRHQVVEDVVSFVGEDESGSFGILPGHDRFITCLCFGLARFRTARGGWQFLAVPGAVLYCRQGDLIVSTRRFLLDVDCERINQVLRQELVAEEAELREVKGSLHRLEEQMLKRLWSLDRTTEPP